MTSTATTPADAADKTFAHSSTTIASHSGDGIKLFIQTWSPVAATTPAKAHVLVVHGYMEHGGRYYELAQYLASRGIAVSCVDLRGHGKSTGDRALIRKWIEYSEDVDAALEHCQSFSTTDAPIYMLGHSNGGTVTLGYAFDNYGSFEDGNMSSSFLSTPRVPVAGFIVTCPFLGPANELPPIKIWISKTLGSCFPTLAMSADDVTTQMLTDDVEKQEEHDADGMLLQKFTLGWASQAMIRQEQLLNEVEVVKDDAFPPVLFAYAAQDRVSHPKLNESFSLTLQESLKGKVTIKEYATGQHEILNETFRVEAYDMVHQWILTQMKLN
mmetsp:Transcript_15884/g.43875  ORF Transcript_15884/g.43875 Transcript_15884/m.43875 type:complete len:327 (-) Transcript_15884:148-1128(-)